MVGTCDSFESLLGDLTSSPVLCKCVWVGQTVVCDVSEGRPIHVYVSDRSSTSARVHLRSIHMPMGRR